MTSAEAQSPKRTATKSLGNYIRFLGLLLLVALLVRIDLRQTLTILSNANMLLVLLAIAANLPQLGLKALRWRFLLHMQGLAYPFRRAAFAYISSIYIGLLTPGRLGEFVKALYVTQDTEMPVSKAMSSVLIDRVFDLYALLICCSYGLVFFSLAPSIASVAKWLIPILAGASLLLIHPQAQRPVCWLLQCIPWIKRYTVRWVPGVQSFYEGIARLWKPKLIVAILLTIAAYLVFFTQCYLLALALELPVAFGFVVFAISTTSLVTLIPISVSGLGTRDAILTALLAPWGTGAEVAIAYSTLILVTFYIAAGGLGAIAWVTAPLDDKLVKQIWPKKNNGNSDPALE